MTRRVMLVMFATLALAAVPVLAHPGHDHKILGTVTMAAADHVMVKGKDGKDVTVHITKATKVLKAKGAAKVEDIQNGMRIVVTAVTETVNNVERLRAKIIEIGPAPTAK